MPIRVKLALAMWLLVAALGGSTTLVADRYLTTAFDAERQRRVQDEAQRLGQVMTRRRARLMDKLDVLATHPDVLSVIGASRDEASGQARATLEALRAALDLDLLAVVTPDGSMVSAAMADHDVPDLPADVAFRTALDGRRYQDMLVRGEIFEMRATRPIILGDRVIGAILAGYLVDERFLDQIHAETGFHAAYTFEATLLQSTLDSFDRIDSTVIFDVKDDLATRAGNGDRGRYVSWSTVLDGTPYDAVCYPLYLDERTEHLGTLVLLVSAAPVLQTRSRARAGMLITGMGGLLLGTVLAIVMATGFSRPIQILADAALAMRKGNLGRRTGIRRGDELGQLARAFDDMADSLQRHVQEVRRLAVTDELTGLSNHRRFKDELEREVERAGRFGTPLCLVFIDIDHFKRVNDTHGHSVGDQVLMGLAGVLRANVRNVDLACRYGGEEFGVILPSTDLPAAVRVAERLREAVAEEPLGTDVAVPVTISAGVSCFGADGTTADALLAAADGRLYRAKAAGRNRVVHEG